MSTLYLTCGLCGRKQADGLLSRGYWGHLEVALHGTLRACPTCKSEHADWQSRLLGTVSANGHAGAVSFLGARGQAQVVSS